MVELVDTRDLKSLALQRACGFKSRPGHQRKSRTYDKNVVSPFLFFSGEMLFCTKKVQKFAEIGQDLGILYQV